MKYVNDHLESKVNTYIGFMIIGRPLDHCLNIRQTSVVSVWAYTQMYLLGVY